MIRTCLCWATLAAILGQMARGDDEPAPKLGHRVVSGRVLDDRGRPPRAARISFAPTVRGAPPGEATTVAIDEQGRYKIEIVDAVVDGTTYPAAGELRSLGLAPGFRPVVGKVEPGAGPSTLDISLTAEPWRETEFRLVDPLGKPVEGVVVDLTIGGSPVWERLQSDRTGAIRTLSPRGFGCQVAARPKAYLPTTIGFRGVADDPPLVTIPLFEPVRGRVVDPDGKPLPGIAIGRVIGPDDFNDDPEARKRTKLFPLIGSQSPSATDAAGNFDLRPLVKLDSRSLGLAGVFRIPTVSLCIADGEFRRLAFLGVDLQAPRRPLAVTLRPARRVRIPVEHEVALPSGRIEGSWDLYVKTGPKSQILAMGGYLKPSTAVPGAKAGDWVEAHWPEGSYQLQINTFDPANEKPLETTQADIVVPPGDDPIDLPTIRLAAKLQHSLVGKPAPEIDAKDLDTGEPVRLADYRGKVVVLDFWGYWCGPCVGSMPGLMTIHDRFKGRPVAIIALHDQSVQTRAAYDRKLDGIRRTAWGDRDLPFRVALDRTDPGVPAEPGYGSGISCRRYEVAVFPTTLLIGRDGKLAGLVDGRDLDKLAAAIDGLLADPPR